MSQLIDSFRTLAEFLVNTYEGECIYFTTDLEKYDFVMSKGLDIPGIQVGERLVEGGNLQKCIREQRPLEGTVERAVYGKRLKFYVRPIVEEGEVKGCYGVYIHKLHRVARAFPDFAGPLAEAFPEGAFLMVTDLEKVVYRQGSKKFDIPVMQTGTILKDDGIAKEAMRLNQGLTKELDANLYGVATRGTSIPLYDPDDKQMVGTFGLYMPQTLAHNLQNLAMKMNTGVQEIASVMEEVAAAASEISMNEGQLAERVKEVAGISGEINEVLDFIKSVADQTKMLGLNAAIEAARAGEHGRGFGVVAEEIRKLSDQSKETADRIRKLMKEINDRIQDVSEASNSSLKQSQEQAAATEEVTASVMEIGQLAEKLTETARSL
jgi:predicted  nucleic acid-binding Zn-ribbon protein